MSGGGTGPDDGAAPGGFVVNLEVFEGPLDLLLDLARKQKVDLGRVSILRLAEQYLAYLEGPRAAEQLPAAAEHLVAAAWLAYLKSQLLLPPPERELPDPEAVAGALEDRLRLLDAIRRGAAALLARPRLGADRFPRGEPDTAPASAARVEYRPALGDLLAAYGAVGRRRREATMTFPARQLDSVEAALERLGRLLLAGGAEWRDLMGLLPDRFRDGLPRRSAKAASLVAGLELARSGALELRQAAPFAPIMVRRR